MHSAETDPKVVFEKKVCHTHYAFSWVLNVLLIDLLHNLQVLLALAFGLVVMSRAAQAKELALLLDADLALRGNQSSAGISIPNFLDTRLATNHASEYRNRNCSDSVERRRLKP